jgi:hypothetical protein
MFLIGGNMIKRGIEGFKTRTTLTELIKASTKKVFDVHHPKIFGSDAAFCSKKSVLHMAVEPGSDGDTSSASAFYFAIGTAIHEVIDEALSSVSVATELSVRHPIGVNGRIDNLVKVPGGYRIVDTKTCGKLPTKIKQSHKAQLLAYCIISGVRDASIIYMSRNVATYSPTGFNLAIVELVANFTDADFADGCRTMAEGFVYSENKVIPKWEQPGHATTSSCGWCPFIEHCHHHVMVEWSIQEGWRWIDTTEALEYEAEVERIAEKLLTGMPMEFETTISRVEVIEK